MELRRKFNEDEKNYDRARPGYPEKLFLDIEKYVGTINGCKAVEIGIGTGQATKPLLDMGANVLGVELGDKLADYVGEKYREYKNFKVICADFMELDLPSNGFDIVFSATAFHWLPKDTAYEKVLRILKPGGIFAAFWNHPYPNRSDDKSNIASKEVYSKHRPGGKAQKEFSQSDTEPRIKAMNEAGFADVECKLYKRVRTLTTQEYIALINTYSDHRALSQPCRTAFETDMRSAIDGVGGRINIYDTIDLYLGRKGKR